MMPGTWNGPNSYQQFSPHSQGPPSHQGAGPRARGPPSPQSGQQRSLQLRVLEMLRGGIGLRALVVLAALVLVGLVVRKVLQRPEEPLPAGTTTLTFANSEWNDGVVFCRGAPTETLAGIFLDRAMTQGVARSDLDISNRGAPTPTAQRYGQGVPQGTTLAIALRRGESRTLYISPTGTWTSGACWFQDVTSNAQFSLAGGPQFMSQVEFTIEPSGVGAVWFDMSSVEGVSGGMSISYTDDYGATAKAVAAPSAFQGTDLQVVDRLGFKTVLSDKNQLGVANCRCSNFTATSVECNQPACFASCPGELVENPCGQHRCRTFYAKQYQSPTSYCGWLYSQKAQTYCWAMDEWMCEDESCGYGGLNQPAEDCSTPLPPDAAANSYSCGNAQPGMGLRSMDPLVTFWLLKPGCSDKLVNGVPTNPAPKRFGGRIQINFIDLPWLRGGSGQVVVA